MKKILPIAGGLVVLFLAVKFYQYQTTATSETGGTIKVKTYCSFLDFLLNKCNFQQSFSGL